MLLVTGFLLCGFFDFLRNDDTEAPQNLPESMFWCGKHYIHHWWRQSQTAVLNCYMDHSEDFRKLKSWWHP